MEVLERQMQGFGEWRSELVDAIRLYGRRLAQAGVDDPDTTARVARMSRRLAEDRLSVAVVAELSRGKSELINAMFFGSAGRRVLPSSAGRTTMCPTELRHDEGVAASIRLLPIQTRMQDVPVSELRADPKAWQLTEFNPADPQATATALAAVSETILVSAAEAALMGFGEDELDLDAAGESVQIPRWRHAIVNYPHPLLQQGLVILDTPGLNAMGTEPELTLRLIPDADAVLFVLAADTGVTRSDIEVWRHHIEPNQTGGRLVVLNKIDGFWDGIRDEVSIEVEIARQVGSVSSTLGVPAERVFPVSAQKALVARLRDDAGLLRRSRIADLESALSGELIPRRRALVRANLLREFDEISRRVETTLGARRRSQLEQQAELEALRGRNRDSIARMSARVQRDREEFSRAVRQLAALRTIFSRHSRAITASVGGDVARRRMRASRDAMKASRLSVGLRDAMAQLIEGARQDFAEVARQVDELGSLMQAMYRSFTADHGLALTAPADFQMDRLAGALDRIDAIHRSEFGAFALVSNPKYPLMSKFFESVAVRVRDLYDRASRELDNWQRGLISPIEAQVRELQQQLRRRGEAVQQVLEASGSLDARIEEIQARRQSLDKEIAAVESVARDLRVLLEDQEALSPLVA
jgi:hypothetical protein